MFARILKSGSFHDVVGYVTRQFFSHPLEQLKGHDPTKYTPDTWRVIDSDNILTLDSRRMVQSFEVFHDFMPEKEAPAGHIAISFDIADAPSLTDEFMTQLAKEYMEGMGIKDTQYLVIRHLETDHPHFHIVYNRMNMQGKAVDERNNFKRSDKVVKAIKNQTQVTVNTISNMLKPVLKQISDLGIELDDSIIETIAQKCSDKAFSKRYSQLEDSAERLNYRINNLVNGAIWASIPRWFYVSFFVFFIAACGFGYGFFHLLNQNDRLTDVEWLYRRERTYYRTDEEKVKLSNTEREFLTGSPHEQDSIKNLIRQWEHKFGADKTYLYFNPTEDLPTDVIRNMLWCNSS